MATVTQALNNAFGQRQVSTIYNAMNQYRVVMEVAPEFAQGPESLDRVLRRDRDGQPRAAVGVQPLHADVANDRISHQDQFASESVSFELDAGRQPEPGTGGDRPRRGDAHDADLDPGTPAGQRQPVPAMQGNQAIAILGTLLIVFIVLGVLYESYLHPLTILSTLPSAGVGALLALLLLNTEFSLVALLGLFLLIGVVMKNAILMIDVALQLERETGVTPEEAIREACLLRLRPILMTTMSALLGALPLMLVPAKAPNCGGRSASRSSAASS